MTILAGSISDHQPTCCRCHIDSWHEEHETPWHGRVHFIVCDECGNKRCPKATNCLQACTGSNAPGQAGSAIGGQP